jgi:hypothetical protein
VPLLAVGHGPEDRAPLGARLTAAGIASLVNIRRFPGSRNNPDVARDALASWPPRPRDRIPVGGVADVAVLARAVPVDHLMPDGRLTPHRPSEGAVLTDGVLTWPAPDVDQET